MRFDNTYARLPERFFASVRPETVSAPELLAWNEPLAHKLGFDDLSGDPSRLAQIFSGNELPPDAFPIALAYAGHQFAHFVPQLGDGRAVLLGEVVADDGARFDIQLKGSGRTPFSRGGDGKSALGPVVREYLVSEAMHALGVPTTRALAAVRTGDMVMREGAQPGGVFTRVAASHLRVGTFQYFAAQDDRDGVKALADYAIQRHYPHAVEAERPYLALFDEVVGAHARLVAHWMSLGFIHGVMNTDNTSISGETIDYGPCAFMDEFRSDKVFSSIDRFGRYAYANQPAIAHWNLARLAECLLLIDQPVEAYEQALDTYPQRYENHHLALMRPKLGLTTEAVDDGALIEAWLSHLQEHELDFTLSFRRLAECLNASTDEPTFGEFEARWRHRLAAQPTDPAEQRALMNRSNPRYIPRNHRIEEAIRGAVKNDLTVFEELQQILADPFQKDPSLDDYATPPKPQERVLQTFCGT